MTKVLADAVLSAALLKSGLKSLFKQAAIISAILLALTGICSPLRAAQAAPNPAGFDILGMKLGMSVAQIEAAIKTHDPSLMIIVTKGQMYDSRFGIGQFVQFVHAVGSGPTAEDISVGFTVTQPARAFYIGRFIAFPTGQQPLADKTVQQLREKYGPESKSLNNNTAFYWVFDKAGKQLSQTDCAHDDGPSLNGAPSYGGQLEWQTPFGSRGAPRSYSPNCGVDLAARLVSPPDTHLLVTLFEQLAGDSIAVDDIRKAMAEAKAEQDKQRQQQEKKASGVKPAL